ncbi:MAG TPA: hypothetical protein V6D10_24085 [Trichocoleus sp.]
MNLRLWMVGLCVVSGLTACNNKTASTAPQPEVKSTVSVTAMNPNGTAEPTAQSFPNPNVASTRTSTLPIPELIPPTTSIQRLPQIEVGRSDPFAALPLTPTIVPKENVASTQPSPFASVPAAPVVVSPQPATTVSMLPPPANLPFLQPAPVNINQLPVAPVIPRRSPTALAETIEISGVLQVGGKTNVIVKVPDESTSRYVTVGDSMANGQVRVKRVEMGIDPVIVLEQNGKEVTRSVGSV